MTDAEKEAAKNIIGAASTAKYRRVFFLGPYARRVSLASMQHRTLNLIWALQGSGRISRGEKVAVVGGGLSGMMATACLLDLGYSVTMYEGGETVLNRQESADHRHVHPTVNQWPDGDVAETTEVPYFDWFASAGSKVVKALRKEWETVRRSSNLQFIEHAQVIDFAETHGLVGVETLDPSPGSRNRYVAALVTSGFADEDYGDPLAFPGYWYPDGLEAKVTSPAMRNAKYVISGCGDGGLIEALRIAHKDFAKGALIVTTARRLSQAGWAGAEDIRQAEADLAADTPTLERAIRSGSDRLQQAYLKAAAELPPEVLETLNASLRLERNVNLVTLVSREENAFSPMSAPIHKLMVAHALEAMTVRHLSRTVTGHHKSHLEAVPSDTDPADFAKTPKEPIEGHVILRHGAQPSFKQFFKKDPVIAERLAERQKLLAADLDRPIWKTGGDRLKEWPPTQAYGDELKKRYPGAAKLIRKLSGIIGGRVHWDEDRGFLFYHDDDQATTSRADSLPKKLFGFDLLKFPESLIPNAVTKPAGSTTSAPSGPAVPRPGAPIVSALNGRLGPLLEDGAGRLFALTAAHLNNGAHPRGLPVTGAGGEAFGAFAGDTVNAALSRADIALVEIADDAGADPSYAGHDALAGTIDARDAAGAPVLLERASGATATGYVSATSVGATFRHPGSGRDVVVRDAVRIRSADPSSPFAAEGDSGAPVVDGEGRLLGMVMSVDDRYTYVVPVADVATRLGLSPLRNARPPSEPGAGGEPGVVAELLNLLAAANRRDVDLEVVDLGPPPPGLADGRDGDSLMANPA